MLRGDERRASVHQILLRDQKVQSRALPYRDFFQEAIDCRFGGSDLVVRLLQRAFGRLDG
jgi:hypothetical protein